MAAINESEQTKVKLARLFDTVAVDYDQYGPHFFAYFGQRFVELAKITSGMRVLDVATGRGAVLFPATEIVTEVIGTDLSEGMVQLTQQEVAQRGLKNVRVLQMDAEVLQFPDASFDCVLCSFAFSFFPNQSQALSEFYRVLKPSGLLGISSWGRVDDRWRWVGEVIAGSAAKATGRGPSFTEPNNHTKQLAEAGFADVHIETVEADLVYADAQDWWNAQWSHAMRATWLRFPPDVLAKKKTEALAHAEALQQPDGLHQNWEANFTFGIKPE